MKTAHVAVGAAGFLALVLGFLLGGSAAAIDVLLNIGSVAVVAAAGLFATAAARAATGRTRTAWTVMALGLASAVVAEAIWAYRNLAKVTLGFPSPADAFYLVLPVATVAALLLFPRRPRRYSPGRAVLDGLIIAASMLMVAWVTVMRPSFTGGRLDAWQLVTALAYPVLDVIAFAVAAVVLALAGGRELLPLSLITAGLAVVSLAESLFASLAVGGGPFSGHHVVETTWLAGMVLILVGAAAGRGVRFGQSPAHTVGWFSVVLPFTPLMLAAVVLAAQPYSLSSEPVVVAAGLVLIPAVLLRQVLAVAEGRRLVAQVTEQAQSDPLTGLANRSRFKDVLAQAIPDTGRDGRSIAVLLLDLDDFKLLNDSEGHDWGDVVLIAVAERLREHVASDHLVARLGGDEFAVLVRGRPEEIEHAADNLMAAFDSPFTVDGVRFDLRTTVGVAIAENADVDARELVKRADEAMYAGKRAQRGGARSPDTAVADRLSATVPSSLRRVGELRSAVEQGELTLVYQPKIDLRTGRAAGVEALLRWPHRDRGLLTPRDFLPLVRRHGLIEQVTELAVGRALDDVRVWRRGGLDISVAVNMFAPRVGDRRLPEMLAGALDARGLPGSALVVEITEDFPIGAAPAVVQVLTELRRLGIRVAVDDFGAGYSTVADVCRLPIDELKLDVSLVRTAHLDHRVATVLRTMVGMAAELGMTSVAEGVESPETADLLLSWGCDQAQGNHFSPPLAVSDVVGFLRSTSDTSEDATAEIVTGR